MTRLRSVDRGVTDDLPPKVLDLDAIRSRAARASGALGWLGSPSDRADEPYLESHAYDVIAESSNDVPVLLAEVERLRQLATPTAGPRTWSLPAEPGPEVAAVRCGCCAIRWTRIRRQVPQADLWAPNDAMLGARSWRALVVDHSAPGSPLTDATGGPS